MSEKEEIKENEVAMSSDVMSENEDAMSKDEDAMSEERFTLSPIKQIILLENQEAFNQ